MYMVFLNETENKTKTMESIQLSDDAVKCVVVGDSGVGKTRLICARACGTKYSLQQLMRTHVPTVWAIDHYRNNPNVQERSWCTVDGVTVPLCLWDTFGYHDKDRQFAYGRADVVLICFSLVKPRSLQNIVSTWHKELLRYCPDVPVIVVGCQADLRYLYNNQDFLSMDKGAFFKEIKDEDVIFPSHARSVIKSFGFPYYETSVLIGYGIEEVFTSVVRAGLIKRRGAHILNALSLQLKKVKNLHSVQKPFLPPKPKMPNMVVPPSRLKEDTQKMLETSNDESMNSDLIFVVQDTSFYAHTACVVAGASLIDFLLSKNISNVNNSVMELLQDDSNIDSRNSNQTHSKNDLELTEVIAPKDVKVNKCKQHSTACQKIPLTGFHCIQQPSDGNAHHTVITVNESIQVDTFRYVLEYIYTATCADWPRCQSELHELQGTAQMLGLSGLVTMVTNILCEQQYLNSQIEKNILEHRCARIRKLLIDKSELADIEFELEDGSVFAHKCLLMARSQVLNAMFSYNFREHAASKVALPGIGCVAFTALLAYLYTDLCPDLSTVDALDMLELANCYCLPRLVALTEEHIISELQQKDASGADVTEDVLLLLEHAQLYNAAQLSEWCLCFLCVNYQQIYAKHVKLLHRLQPANQVVLHKHRWPPLWYLEEYDYYEKKMIEQERESKSHRNFKALKRSCFCIS